MTMSRKADPQNALIAAIAAQLLPATVSVVQHRSTPWASATFTGARHDIDLTVEGPDAPCKARFFVESAPTADYAINGHLVADVVVTTYLVANNVVQLSVEILTVEAV